MKNYLINQIFSFLILMSITDSSIFKFKLTINFFPIFYGAATSVYQIEGNLPNSDFINW